MNSGFDEKAVYRKTYNSERKRFNKVYRIAKKENENDEKI